LSNQITKFRVAIVDSEPIVADTLAEILNLHGYEAKAHYCGESALADAKLFCPQVVLSDVDTRKIDGIETALRFREGHPECRIILFTASPIRSEIYARIEDLGFEFLQRPLHPREVLALLRAKEKHSATSSIPAESIKVRIQL
jgi:DNA-binding response OmpR family regulator